MQDIHANQDGTQLLRIPKQVYANLLEPYLGQELEVLRTENFSELVFTNFPGVRDLSSMKRQLLVSLATLRVIPPEIAICFDSQHVQLLFRGKLQVLHNRNMDA